MLEAYSPHLYPPSSRTFFAAFRFSMERSHNLPLTPATDSNCSISELFMLNFNESSPDAMQSFTLSVFAKLPFVVRNTYGNPTSFAYFIASGNQSHMNDSPI